MRQKNVIDPAPFIVGVSRSGTTLLRLMLDAHPEVAVPPETHFIPHLFQLCQYPLQEPMLREMFMKIITSNDTWTDFHLSASTFRSALEQIAPFTITDGLRCFYKMYADRFNKSRWGDKTPLYNLHMTRVRAIIPEAHFIHLIRDGRDVALSLRHLWFGPGEDIKAQARDWVGRILEARRQAAALPRYLEIRYEDLVANPKAVLERVCDYIGLPYHADMEQYHLSAPSRLEELTNRYNPDGTVRISKDQLKGIFKLTAGPTDRSRIGRWRTEMTPVELAEFEEIAGDLLRDFGYEVD